MKKSTKNIASTVANLVGPVISELNYDLWDVEYVKEGAEFYLRITSDREEGISIDDCEKVHRAIDPLLDEADPIEDSYHLEVSSPGIERELKYDWHYESFIGALINIKFYAPVNGTKSILAVLKSKFPGKLAVEFNGDEFEFEDDKIAKVTLAFDFQD